MKNKTDISILDNLGIRRKADIEIGDNGSYESGLLVDANAVEKMIGEKVDAVIDGASSTMDTLKEVETEISDLPTIRTSISNLLTQIDNGTMVDLAGIMDAIKFNGHEYVDLGLPSGRLWAKCNIGAISETDYGLYFAWASNVGYAANGNTSSHDFSTGQQTPYYIRRDEDEYDVYARYVDGETLSLGDDAARNNMGGNWRIPTKDDYQELYDYCNTNGSVEWVTMNGVNGRKFTSPNGQYVFFPAAGSCDGTSRTGLGSDGSYWSSTCYSSDGPGEIASYLYFDSSDVADTAYFRFGGFSVRGVQ